MRLPSYALVNLGLLYEMKNWAFSVMGKNLTDERYFRANFPNLFGGTIVLPELPRSVQASVAFEFSFKVNKPKRRPQITTSFVAAA